MSALAKEIKIERKRKKQKRYLRKLPKKSKKETTITS
jgi:hypothetical protein